MISRRVSGVVQYLSKQIPALNFSTCFGNQPMIAKSWFDRCWQWKIGGCVAIFGTLCAMGGDRVNAQIVPDNTLGAESSVVTPDVNIQGIPSDQIDDGATRGANLFHSFQDFNVEEGRGAYFANPRCGKVLSVF